MFGFDVMIVFYTQIDRLCGTVCVQDPPKTCDAVKLDSMTLHSYIEQHAWTAGQFKFTASDLSSPPVSLSSGHFDSPRLKTVLSLSKRNKNEVWVRLCSSRIRKYSKRKHSVATVVVLLCTVLLCYILRSHSKVWVGKWCSSTVAGLTSWCSAGITFTVSVWHAIPHSSTLGPDRLSVEVLRRWRGWISGIISHDQILMPNEMTHCSVRFIDFTREGSLHLTSWLQIIIIPSGGTFAFLVVGPTVVLWFVWHNICRALSVQGNVYEWYYISIPVWQN